MPHKGEKIQNGGSAPGPDPEKEGLYNSPRKYCPRILEIYVRRQSMLQVKSTQIHHFGISC